MNNKVATALKKTVNDEPVNPQPKPVLVRAKQEDTADQIVRRVAAAVDRELANGSLPA